MEDSDSTSQGCRSRREWCCEGMPSRRRDLVPGRSVRAVATTGTLVVLRRCWTRERPMPRDDGVTSVQAMELVLQWRCVLVGGGALFTRFNSIYTFPVSRAEPGVQLTMDDFGNSMDGVRSCISSSLSLTSFGCRNHE